MSPLTSRLVFSAAVALASVPALADEPSPDAPPVSAEDAALIEAIISDLGAVFDGPDLGKVGDDDLARCRPRVCCIIDPS